MIIDTHAHLDVEDFRSRLPEVIGRAGQADVTEIISIAASFESNAAIAQIIETWPNVHGTVGIHPECAGDLPADWLTQLKARARHPKIAAVGEIGLDYYRLPSIVYQQRVKEGKASPQDADVDWAAEDRKIKEQQERVFRAQLDLAIELGLNAVIHQRESWDDLVHILSEYKGRLRTVFHCFGGTIEQARQLLAQNHLVSFTGIVTFKNAKQVQETAAALPANAFMVETDCPYLAPTPYRGQTCEPWHTRLVVEKIAELRNTTWQEVAHETTRTAKAFFRHLGMFSVDAKWSRIE